MRTKNSLKSRLEISNEEDKSANETRKSKRVNKTKISPPPKENASKTLSAFDSYLSSDDELFDKKSARTNFRRQKGPVASNLKKKCENSVVVGVECKKPVKTKCKTHIDSQATVTGACYSGRPYKKLYDKDINRNSAADVTTVSCEDKDRKGTSAAFLCVSKRQTYDNNSDVSSETLKSARNRKQVRDEKSALLQAICSSADEQISDKQSDKSSIALNVMCQKSSERQPILCCNDEASVSCSRSSYKASQMVSIRKFDKMSDLVGRCEESQRETIEIGKASTSSCSINSFPHTEKTTDKELHRAKNIEFSNDSLQRDRASSRSCPVCNMIFPDLMTQDESNRHVNSCLDISKTATISMDNPSFNKEYLDAKSSTPMNKSDEELARDLQRREQEKYLEERLSDGLFFCSFCQKNLSNMNPGTRQTHMNKCADLQDKLMAESKKAEKKLLAKGNTGEFECFICGLRFSSMKSRISHMKLCCKEKSVSPKDVLSLMKCELSNIKQTRDAEDPANRKSDTRGLDGKDENEITTAVSNVNVLKSLGKNTVAANTNAGKKRKVNRKKRHEEVPALLTRNEEKAKDLLMKKAACIIALQLEMSNAREPVCSLPPSTLAKKYLKSYSHKGNGSCSSFAFRPFDDPTESEVDSNQCTRVTKEATNQDLSLWNLAAINTTDTTLSPFYVQDVFNEDYKSMEKLMHQKSLAVKSPVSPSSNANRNEEESESDDDEEVPKRSESEGSEVDKEDDASNVGASFAMTQQEKAAVLDQLGCARMHSQPNDESDMEQSNAPKRGDEADSIHCSGFCRPSDIEEPDIQKMLQSYKKEAQDSLIEDMKILLADESTKDVKIKCCDGEIRAHSLILRIRCPQLLKVASNGGISLIESSCKAVQCLLAHLYTGSIDFRSDLMTEISSLAYRFSLEKLSEVCDVIQKKTEGWANAYYETNDLDKTVNVLIKNLWENEDTANDNKEPSEFENSGENSEFDENDAEDLRTYFATQRERKSSDACAARRVSDIESHSDIDLLLSDKYEEKTKSDSCADQNEFFDERCAIKQCDPEVHNHSDTDSMQSGRGSVHAKMSSKKGEELCPIENTGDSTVKSRNDGIHEFSEETQAQFVFGKSDACSNNNSICFGNSFNVSLDEIPMITAEEAADIHIISDSEVFSSFLQGMTDPVDDIAEAVNYPGDGDVDVDFDLPGSCPEGSPSVNLAVNRKLESLHSTSVAVVDSSRLSPCYAYTEDKIDVCPDENVLNEKSTNDDIDMDVPAFGRGESPPANLKVSRKLALSSLKLAAKDSETLPSCSEYIENRSSISTKDANSDERRSDTELHQANTVDASDIENQIADDNDDDFSKSDESNDLVAGLHNKENDFVMSSIKQQKERISKHEKSLYLVSPLRRTPSAFEKTFVTPEFKEIEEDGDENTYSSKLVETDGEEVNLFCDKQGQQDKLDEGNLNEYDHNYQDHFYDSDQNDNGDLSADGDKNYTGRNLYDVDHNVQRVRSRDDSDNGHENAKGDSFTDADENYECDHFDTSLIDNDFPPSPELIEEAPESPCLVTLKYQCEHAEIPSERETSETEQEDIQSPGNTKINSFDEGIDEGNSTGVRSQFDTSLRDNSDYVVATSPKKSRLSVRSKEKRTTVRCGDMATITGDASHHAQSLQRPSVNTSTPLKRKNISVNSLQSSDSDQQLKLSTNSPSKKKLKTSKGSKRSKEAFKALLKKAAGRAECEGSLSERATSCSEAEPTIPDISCGVVQVKRSSYRFRKVPLLEKERGKSRESPLRMPMKSGSHTQLCSERTMNVSESATIVRNSIESGSNSCQSNISSPEDDDLESGLENSNYRNDEHLCEIVNESRDLNVRKCSKTENSCCSEPEIVEGQRVLDKPGIRKMSGANEAARSLEESRTSKKRLYAEFLRSFDEDSSLNEASGSDGTVCERNTDEFEKSTAEMTSTRLNTSEDACKDSHRNIKANVENDSVSGMNSACFKVDDCFESKFHGIGPLGNIADVDDSTASIVSFSRCQENFSYRVNENVEGNKNAIEECESGEDTFTSDRVFFEEDYSGLVYAEGCPKSPDIKSKDENMDLNSDNDACFNDFEPECFIDDGGFNCDMAENMAFDSQPGSSCLQNVTDGSSQSSLENVADGSKEPVIESPCVTSFKYKRKIANRANRLETSNNERSSRKSLQNSDVMNFDGRNCEAKGNSTNLFTSGTSDDDVIDQSQIKIKRSYENKENVSTYSRTIVSTVSNSGNEDMKSISSGRYPGNESPSVCIANDTDESSDLDHSDGGSTQDAEASNEEIDAILMLASGTPSSQAKINQPNIPVVRTPHTALRNFGPGCTVHPETNLPITPMTDYSALETPVLTKRVKVFGMRKLPKRKMVGKLKEIFKAQHGFKNWEEAPPKLKRKRKKETGAMGKKDSKAKKPSGIRDSDRDSEGYSSSTDQRRKTFEGQLESDTDSLSQSSQTEKEESLFDKLLHFIQNHAELYEKALTYQKFDFVELHKLIKDSGMKCSKNRLADFLDEQCICYIFPKSSDKRNARRKRGPKPKKAKHVEI